MDGKPSALYEEAVFPEAWDLPTPPVKIRIPEGFDPKNPAHIEAAQQTYQKAYDPISLNQTALAYLSDLQSQGQRVAAQTQAVQSALKELEVAGKQKYVLTQSGRYELPVLSAKQAAQQNLAIARAKEKVKTAEAGLAEANKPIESTVFEVQLPQAEETKEQPQAAQQLAPAKDEVSQQVESAQMQRYNAIKRDYLKQAQQFLAQPGVNRAAVEAGLKNAMAQLDSEWQPEEREINGILYSYSSPNKREIIRDNVAIAKEQFNENVKNINRTKEGVDHIDAIRATAEEASKLTGVERAARIKALLDSLKAVNSGVVGTSDALQQAEYKRLGGSLEVWDLMASLKPDSLVKFSRTNPEGFAKSMEIMRNMAGRRMVGHFNQAEKLAKTYPVFRDLIPDKPSYYNKIVGVNDQGQVIQKGQQAAPQQKGTIVTKGGTGLEIRKIK